MVYGASAKFHQKKTPTLNQSSSSCFKAQANKKKKRDKKTKHKNKKARGAPSNARCCSLLVHLLLPSATCVTRYPAASCSHPPPGRCCCPLSLAVAVAVLLLLLLLLLALRLRVHAGTAAAAAAAAALLLQELAALQLVELLAGALEG
jgi:hypothetical protein